MVRLFTNRTGPDIVHVASGFVVFAPVHGDEHPVVIVRIDDDGGTSADCSAVANPAKRACGSSAPDLKVHNVLYGLPGPAAGRLAFCTTVY